MRIGILGGSFNPIHNGHLRLGLEALEQIHLQRVDFVPALHPPHKTDQNLLPFDLRYRLIQEAVSQVPGLEVNTLEGKRNGPSYTVDTLKEYHSEYPENELFFILGCNDFLTVPNWQDGIELFHLSNFVVVGRLGLEKEQIEKLLYKYFPRDTTRQTNPKHWTVMESTQIHYLENPGIQISSTLIRKKWSQGSLITYLVPEGVERLLNANRSSVKWDL